MKNSEYILQKAIESKKHKMADFLNDTTREMVIDCIEIALAFKNDKELQSFDIEFKEDNSILIQQSSYFNKNEDQ